jgi:nucleotide-binding universal stress UspA family protein
MSPPPPILAIPRAEPTSVGAARPECVMLATDGGPDATGAVAIAGAMAEGNNRVRVLTVVPHLSTAIVDAELALPLDSRPDVATHSAERTRRAVGDQLPPTLRSTEPTIVEGRVVSTIVRIAREWDARLILIGLHRHPLLGRLTGEETTLRVARSSPVPVLAATASTRGIPQRILVAVDFSTASLRAARTALTLAREGAHITLVHVRPVLPRSRVATGEPQHYAAGIAGGMAQLQGSLDVPRGCVVDSVTLNGEPATELRRIASAEGADLIAVGTHRHSFVGRMVVGSVTTDLLRHAERTILVIPPEAPAAA